VITLPLTPPKGSDQRDPATRSRRRFARRQWLRRWLVWRYVIGSVLLVVLSIAGVWLVFVSSTLTV
jgi:cell division protein FtsQ